MKRFFVLLFVSFGISSSINGQTNLDSLRKVCLDTELSDTSKLNALHQLAFAYLRSKPDSALYFADMEYFIGKQTNSEKWMANGLNIRGIHHGMRGNVDSAMYFFKQCEVLYEKAKDLTGQANIINNLGMMHRRTGKLDLAIVNYRKALDLYTQLKRPEGRSMALLNIGTIFASKGEPDSSIFYFKHALTIQEELKDTIRMGMSVINIGQNYSGMGDYNKASSYFERGLNLFEALNDLHGQASAMRHIGMIHYNTGDDNEAMRFFQRELELHEEMKNPSGMAGVYLNMGNVYKKQGNYDKSIRLTTKGLKMAETTGDKKLQIQTLNNIASIYASIDELDRAIEFHSRSKSLADELGNPEHISRSLHNLADIYGTLGKLDTALTLARQSLELNISSKMALGTAYDQLNIGNILRKMGDLEGALQMYLECIAGLKDLSAKNYLAEAHFNTGTTYLLLNNVSQAIQHGEDAMALAFSEGVSLSVIGSTYELLYNAYKKQGREGEALKAYESYISTRDSLKSEANQREVFRQEYAYQYEKEALTDSLEFAKKEAVMTERSEKQQLGLFAAGSGLLLLLSLAVAIHKGKKKSDELLLNILPAETAQELKEKGHSDAQLIDHVTVLFTDFKGFTALSEQVTPKELVADLHECFSAFDKICEKYGIEKIKTIGDAYMAAGGLPSPNSTHAHDVVKAALEMAEVVEKGKVAKKAYGRPFFEIRIGVHTGPVVASIVGVKKFQYDIWGDTVNTASRMESSGEVGKVNISQTTYELVKDQFTCEYRGEVEAKGKGKLKMYFVRKSA